MSNGLIALKATGPREVTFNSISQLNHYGAFQRSWAERSNTRLELPQVDVNRTLAEHYRPC